MSTRSCRGTWTPSTELITAALAAIALIVVLITIVKLHPFLALILGGLTVGIVAGKNDWLGDRRDDHRELLMVGLVEGLSTGETSLLVLAIGAGSLFFSHVNDAGSGWSRDTSA